MTDEFNKEESANRFKVREDRIRDFRAYLDVTVQRLSRIPETGEEERTQKNYIIDELRTLERRMDVFIEELKY